MGRLKYRIWDNQENKYYKPTYEGYNRNIEELLLSSSGELSMRTFYNFIHESCFQNRFTIEQCTGLKDKNGKLIFEGDIYHQGDINITYTVVYHDTSLIGKQDKTSGSYAGLSYWLNRIEVIGNIHDKGES